MMKTVFITGASRGIGAALTQHYLNSGWKVMGISRNHKVNHPNYFPIVADLSDEDTLAGFDFPEVLSSEMLVLINNAGTLGRMEYTGRLMASDILSALRLNIAAVAVLSNKFVAKYGSLGIPLRLLNMSSGSGINPYDGWSLYCMSKAAINMFTQVLRLELQLAGNEHIHSLALAPGIIETDMQAQIRGANPESFSLQPRFVEFKKMGQLRTPADVAPEIAAVIEKMPVISEAYVDLRL